jgi:hypothetical protein
MFLAESIIVDEVIHSSNGLSVIIGACQFQRSIFLNGQQDLRVFNYFVMEERLCQPAKKDRTKVFESNRSYYLQGSMSDV